MKSVLITGATSGLGKILAKKLLKEYNVYCLGRNKLALSDLESIGCKTLQVDFSKPESVWLKSVKAFCPDVDILINNAGTFPIVNIVEASIQHYDTCFSVNVRAPFILMNLYMSKMVKKGDGCIVNVLSSSAYSGSKDTGIYCASKHALLGLSRSAFLECRGTGVRICSVAPGSMQTPMGETDTRQDFSTFIETEGVCDFLEHVLASNKTLVYDEVKINRSTVR